MRYEGSPSGFICIADSLREYSPLFAGMLIAHLLLVNPGRSKNAACDLLRSGLSTAE